MKLQEKLKDDLKESMKKKDILKRDTIRVVIGELNRVGKELSDDQVIRIIKKMKENAEDLANYDEAEILDKYLPTLLGEKQLESLISGIISKNGYTSMKDMGNIMRELKENYGSEVDGKLASQVVKKQLM